MTREFLFAAVFSWFALGASWASATPQLPSQAPHGYYIYDGKTLQSVDEDPSRTRYTQWQVWLYPRSARLSASSPYARWGAVQGSSSAEVMKRLPTWQSFERAYINSFGAAAWGWLTFSNPVGPIAVTAKAETRDTSGLIAEADELNRRISSVIAAILPSLINNQSSEPSSAAAGYLGQVRDCLQGVAKFYDQVARLQGESGFWNLQLARLRDQVVQAEDDVPKITAIMPSVKLPVAKGWMTQTEFQGSDGTVETSIMEIGSSAWIRRAWSGGDGSMTGTVIVTVVPYQNIGRVELAASGRSFPSRWTLSIRAAEHAWFPQSITGPARTTSKRSLVAVDFMSDEWILYLDFSSPDAAQDAYAFFLYHKQLGK